MPESASPPPASIDAPVVRLTGVALTYPGPPPVEALRHTDLAINAGEFVTIVGPSGSGKSTLLRVLGLLDRATAGRYDLAGVDVGTLTESKRTSLRGGLIGFVFQEFHLLPHRTAVENVSLAQLYHGIRRRERERAAVDALQRVGLTHRLHALPTTLSGGERQRVAIARALATRPSVLLCDEPTGNLDTATSAAVLEIIGELHASGLTVVLVTHDPAAAEHAQRILEMRDGSFVPRG
jgi:putative ABC transport system ATP-binding protein